jgi:hypothetical protein
MSTEYLIRAGAKGCLMSFALLIAAPVAAPGRSGAATGSLMGHGGEIGRPSSWAMRLLWLPIAAVCAIVAIPADAATCANGVYRAGCVGPNGAVIVNKPPATRPPAYYHPGPPVTCANGVYRAGCVGPNGAAVVRKPY